MYSGPGRVIVRSVSQQTLKVVLANYDVNGDQPKAEHTNFLDTRIVPALAGTNGQVEVVGAASHSGSEGHNLALSGRRATNIINYLVRAGVQTAQITMGATGEFRATPRIREHDEDRNVTLYVGRRARRRPPPPPRVRPAPRTGAAFEIRMLGAFGLESVFGHDHIGFQIWDHVRHQVAIYQYTGANAGEGGGVSFRGPWNALPAPSATRLEDFQGWAHFGGYGALWWDSSYLLLRGNPAGRLHIMMDPFQTGFTLGANVSIGVGRLEMVGPPMTEAQARSNTRMFGWAQVP